MTKLFLKLTALLLISFALNAIEAQPQAYPIATEQINRPIPSITLHGAVEKRLKKAQFSPDGTKIVTFYGEQHAKTWDALNGEPLKIFPEIKQGFVYSFYPEILSAQFSPDSKKLLATFSIGFAEIWDAETGNSEHVFYHEKYSTINSAQFSRDGRYVVTASKDGSAKIWDVKTGTLLKTLLEPSRGFFQRTDMLYSAEFSPDEKYVVTASYNGVAKIWDLETGRPLHSLELNYDGLMYSATFSRDSKKVLTISSPKKAQIWDAETGKRILTFNNVIDAKFSPDCSQLITIHEGPENRNARIWDIKAAKELHKLEGHTSNLNSAEFSPDGLKVVTASNDGTAKLWDVATGRLELNIAVGESGLSSAHFSPDGRKIVTTSLDGTCKIWTVSDTAIDVQETAQNRIRLRQTTRDTGLFQNVEPLMRGLLKQRYGIDDDAHDDQKFPIKRTNTGNDFIVTRMDLAKKGNKEGNKV